MDVLIRYFNADDHKMKTRYLESHFLGHSTHRFIQRIQQGFERSL